LREHQFEARFDQKPERSAWEKIDFPCVLSSEKNSKTSYSFVSKKFFDSISKKHGLALLFVDSDFFDKKSDQIRECFPSAIFLLCNSLEGAFDLILNKISEKEWTAKNCAKSYKAQIEEGAYIGPDCQIAEDVSIESGVRIGRSVTIASGAKILAGTRIADYSVIGKNVQIASGCALGGAGFSMLAYPGDKHRRQRCHIGRLVIEDNCRIGSLVSIDRGLVDDTRIGEGTHIDNHVHIGHNCQIGKNSTICAFAGISGSVKIGEQLVMAGMVGVADNLKIADFVTIGAMSGVAKSIPDSNTAWRGNPARPLQLSHRIDVSLSLLPEMRKFFKRNTKELK